MVFESVTFDYPDFRLNNDSAWIRLRKEGDIVKLAFKKKPKVNPVLGHLE